MQGFNPGSEFYTQCLECGDSVKNRSSLKKHLTKMHPELSFEDYVIRYEHDGIRPVCICGCEKFVNFNSNVYFSNSIKGHLTQEQRKQKSEHLLDFFQTEEGKHVVKERNEKRKAFMQTPEGQEIERRKTEKVIAYNASLEGQAKNERLSREAREFYESEASGEAREFFRQKYQEWHDSEEGHAFRERRSSEMKAYYQTEEGLRELEESAEKIRQKNRLSIEEIRKRIWAAFESYPESTLSILTDYNNDDIYAGITMEVTTLCSHCSDVAVKRLHDIILVPRCQACDSGRNKPEGCVSKEQYAMFEHISSIVDDARLSDRMTIAPLELDIYSPSHAFAVEHNGLYWHSEANGAPLWHVRHKRNVAAKKGIRLFTIFEDEWNGKHQIVQSLIEHKLGFTRDVVYARKCDLVKLDSNRRRDFFNLSHLEGDAKASYAFGLVNENGEIVAAMSLRRPIHKKYEGMYDIARFAVRLNTSVPGALSRLVKRAKQVVIDDEKIGLVSYADLRYGDGVGYWGCGFQYAGMTRPRFWWTDYVRRYNRFQFRARDGKSEEQIARENGVVKIYGDVNRIFVWERA